SVAPAFRGSRSLVLKPNRSCAEIQCFARPQYSLSLMWLATATDTPWKGLAEAIGRGLPVPEGFVVSSSVPEDEIRTAYEDLKIRTRVHFVAVRGPSHSVLNVIGPDPLIHTLRRFWAESVRAVVLVQRMVPA